MYLLSYYQANAVFERFFLKALIDIFFTNVVYELRTK